MANVQNQRIEAIGAEIRSIMAATTDERGYDAERQAKVSSLRMERAELVEEETRSLLSSIETKLNARTEKEQRAAAMKALVDDAFNKQGGSMVLLRAAGDPLVSTGVDAFAPMTIGDVIAPLEKGIHFDELGCKIQTGLRGDWSYPVLSAIEATVAGEAVSITDTELDIDAIVPTPKRVALSVTISKEAKNRAADDLMNHIQAQVSESVRRCISSRLFSATPSVNGIDGPFVAPGVTATYTKASLPTYANLVGLKGAVDSEGVVPDESAAYIMHPAMKATLEATPITVGDSRCIITNGQLNGVPVYTSLYVDQSDVYFGYFSYVLIGQFGDFELGVDASSATVMKKNAIVIVTNSQWDIKAARAEAFGILSESLT